MERKRELEEGLALQLEISDDNLSWCCTSSALSEKQKGQGTIMLSNVLFFFLAGCGDAGMIKVQRSPLRGHKK